MRKPEPKKKKKFLLVAFLALLSQPLFTSPSDDEHTARHKSTRRHLIQLVRIISPGVSLRFVVLLFERHSPLLRHFFFPQGKKSQSAGNHPSGEKKKRAHAYRALLFADSSSSPRPPADVHLETNRPHSFHQFRSQKQKSRRDFSKLPTVLSIKRQPTQLPPDFRDRSLSNHLGQPTPDSNLTFGSFQA